MKKAKKVIISLIVLAYLTGCATQPSKISASYVSPLQYNSYSCDQVKTELLRVNQKVIEVSGIQKKEADKDAVAMGVGLVLFWPALFFMMGDDKKHELSRLKGEYEALETAAIQRECDIAEEIKIARLEREKSIQDESSVETDDQEEVLSF